MKVWRYSVPNVRETFEGWAIVFIDEAGCFGIFSDYGNYGHRWHIGGVPNQNMRQFLINCGDDYLINKLTTKQDWDEAGTRKVIQERIDAHKDDWDEDTLAGEQSLLDDSDMDSEVAFADWLRETKLADAWELARRQYPAGVRAFFERAWPRIKALIDQEIAAECATDATSTT